MCTVLEFSSFFGGWGRRGLWVVNGFNITIKQLNKIALINAYKVIMNYDLKHPETLSVFDTDKFITKQLKDLHKKNQKTNKQTKT